MLKQIGTSVRSCHYLLNYDRVSLVSSSFDYFITVEVIIPSHIADSGLGFQELHSSEWHFTWRTNFISNLFVLGCQLVKLNVINVSFMYFIYIIRNGESPIITVVLCCSVKCYVWYISSEDLFDLWLLVKEMIRIELSN